MFWTNITRFLQYFRTLSNSFINISAILQDFNGIFSKYSFNITVLRGQNRASCFFKKRTLWNWWGSNIRIPIHMLFYFLITHEVCKKRKYCFYFLLMFFWWNFFLQNQCLSRLLYTWFLHIFSHWKVWKFPQNVLFSGNSYIKHP